MRKIKSKKILIILALLIIAIAAGSDLYLNKIKTSQPQQGVKQSIKTDKNGDVLDCSQKIAQGGKLATNPNSYTTQANKKCLFLGCGDFF